MGVIYMITNNGNSKRYVGLDRHGNACRWKKHLRCAKADGQNAVQLIDRKIAQYGPDNFAYEELFTTDDLVELKHQEAYFIATKMTFANFGHGYNLTYGGDGSVGFVMPEEKIRRGERHHMHGKKQSAESNRKRSESMKLARAKSVNPFTTPAVRAKISAHAKTRFGTANPNYRHGASCKSPIVA